MLEMTSERTAFRYCSVYLQPRIRGFSAVEIINVSYINCKYYLLTNDTERLL